MIGYEAGRAGTDAEVRRRDGLRGAVGRVLGARMEVVAAGIIALIAVLLLSIPAREVADLGPLPDAGEYAYAARNLAHLHAYTIALYGAHYPPRYPFGFSALLVPAYWLPGSTLANGLYAVIAMGVAAVVLVYFLARRVAGPVAGIGAAATLLLAPQYLAWNHEVMSETATIAAVAGIALLVLWVAHEEERARPVLLGLIGALAGLALLIRLANGVDRRRIGGRPALRPALPPRGMRHLLLVGIGPALALAGLGVYAQITFGAATGTGYRYWVPDWYQSLRRTFSLSYAVSAPGIAGDSFAPTNIANLSYYGRGLIGRLPLRSLDACSPWFALLALVGCVALARDRRRPVRMLIVFGGVFSALTFALYASYFFQSVRFMAPVMPFLALAAGVAMQTGVDTLRGRHFRRPIARSGGVAILAAAGLGVATALGPMLDASYLYQRYIRHQPAPAAIQKEARTTALYQAVVPDGGVIVSDVFPLILAGAPAAAHATVIPLSRTGYLRSAPLEDVPVFLKRQGEVNAALRAGAPVFTDNGTLGLLSDDRYVDRAHQALRAYGRTAVAQDGPLVVYRLSATVASEAPISLEPLLAATPNPVPAGPGFGTTTIGWDTGDGAMGHLSVSYDGGPERPFDVGESGERTVAWIGSGSRYTFTLYRGADRGLVLKTITVAREGG